MKTIRNLLLALALLGVSDIAHAAALAAPRATASKNTGATKRYPMKASTTIYAGGMVMVNTDGTAEPAAASASNNGVMGVSTATKTSAASGTTWINVQEGWFKFAGTTLGQDDVGELVYAEDDQTVDETASANEPIAGILLEFVDASTAWIYISPTNSVRDAVTADPVTYTGDVTLSGGAGALTIDAASSSIVLLDNSATALDVGSTGLLNFLRFHTTNGAEKLVLTGTTANLALHVDVGLATFDEAVTFAAGAGALTLNNSAASILTIDNDASALDIGSAGATTALRYSSENDAEYFIFNAGQAAAAVSIAGATTLDASDCGKPLFVTAGIDTASITLPALATVPAGCRYQFFYVGADAGALLDISPNAVDGIEGGCTLAASVVYFSGADDGDIGLTKATGLTGDQITLVSGNADDWYVQSCQGIWAGN